ncbi:hypothetical protein BDN70DRAFT_872729 [Pholiota conissans]|uniref:Uncharacterized protein n=1 Tax=Pholiota conissans TaxID=109636 RepID=A0A9P5ZB92_9AGAR|nr:hypothetical protein BDN70DRAFT_872729 [Pholiota conissans]
MSSNYLSVNPPPTGVVFLTAPLHPMSDPPSDKDSVSTESTLQDSSCTEEDPEDGAHEVDIAIDSFIPLLKALDSPAIQLIDDEYHLRGPVSTESLEKLSAYVQRVSCFTITDNEPSLPPQTLWRLVRLLDQYHAQKNLRGIFPSLNELCIIDAHASLDSLNPLFTLPSLRYLDIYDIPEAHRSLLLTFLHNLANDAPELFSIRLDGDLPYQPSLHPACMRFLQLGELLLEKVGEDLDWTTLQEIGQLPQLETLCLKAADVTYSRRNDGVVVKVYDTPPDATSPEMHQNSAVLDSELSSHPALPEDTKTTSGRLPSDLIFRNLKSLDLVAKVDLMSDLVNSISSRKMVAFSLTFISTDSDPAASAPKPKQDSRTAASRRLSKATSPEDSLSEPRRFYHIVTKALETGVETLTTLKINGRHEREGGRILVCPPALRPYTLKALLTKPTLRSLELSGWDVTWDLGKVLLALTSLAQPSKLQTLHLPTSNGISLSTLHTILRSCPSLVSLRCNFFNLSEVPAYPSDNVIFRLKTLGAGSMKLEHYELSETMKIAQYLDAICPGLVRIDIAKDDPNGEQWQ